MDRAQHSAVVPAKTETYIPDCLDEARALRSRKRRWLWVPAFAGATAVFVAGYTTTTHAQGIADFYRGKTLTMLVGTAPGGEYDILARLVAKYIGRHIPGRPTVIVQNMAGASGMKVANFMFTQAPRDGTALAVIQNGLMPSQAVGLPGAQYDAAQFRWLGTIAPLTETLAVWHTAGVRTVADARKREVVVGSTGHGGMTYAFPALMNAFLGTRFKIVPGYESGNPINLAMERGEVEARNNSWSSWKTTKPDWLRDGKIVVIAQAGAHAPDLAAPSLEDLASTADERRIIELVVAGSQFGRPFTTTPGAPEDRVAALRTAFMTVMEDPEFRTEMAKLNFEVNPVGGDALEKTAARVVSTPKDLAARAKPFLE